MKKYLFPILLALPALLPAQTSGDPAFCRELLGKARTALNDKDWNTARDYCETALPLCPGIADSLDAVMKAVTAGVDKEKEDAIKNAELAKRKEKEAAVERDKAKRKELEAATERDKAKTALANLEKSNADVVRLILENADRDVYNLGYEDALEKIKAAASLSALKEETARHYLEIAFWHGEAGNLNRAKNILDSAAMLVNKTASVKQPFRESIKAFDPDVYKKLMERYYPLMVKVEGGTFDMGCDPEIDPNCESDETLHKQEVSSFQIAKYETTWWQYYLFCKATGHEYESPGWGTDGDNPAVFVSWFDAAEYCNWVSRQLGEKEAIGKDSEGRYTVNLRSGYRLPTEAEWEYAAKGGNRSDNTIYSGSNKLDEVGWYSPPSGGRTQQVGSPRKKNNGMGLYDMSGNVREWCWDRFDSFPTEHQPDNKGSLEKKDFRVLRGGSWYNYDSYCRVSSRYDDDPNDRVGNVGFRCARAF